MKNQIRVLLQTTIPYNEDDWHIDRFSLLNQCLSLATDEQGNKVFEVTVRNREQNPAGNDAVLSELDKSDFD